LFNCRFKVSNDKHEKENAESTGGENKPSFQLSSQLLISLIYENVLGKH
jgi:hypothetical protein